MFKFLHKLRKEREEEHDGIMITDKMKIYVIRNTQDNSVLGSILLSDCQFNSLKEALDDHNIIFTRD